MSTNTSNTSNIHPPLWHGMVAGGSSAVISRLFTYPPDTIKSRLQVQGAGGGAKLYTSTSDAFFKIIKTEGVPGFYRGFGAIVLTVIPANMCYFSYVIDCIFFPSFRMKNPIHISISQTPKHCRGYEFGKRMTPRDWGTASDLMTATIAQTIAGIVFCPIDIVKQRVQTANVMNSSQQPSSIQCISPAQAAREVWQHQGLRGFFRGYWTMNALWMPWNLIYLSTYEASKRRIYQWQLQNLRHTNSSTTTSTKTSKTSSSNSPKQKTHNDITVVTDLSMSQVLPAWAFPLCSSSCAALAAVATHPIDVVKTRLQVLTAAEKGQRSRSAWQTAVELFQREGMAGFSRGIGARVATLSVGSSASWFCYEMVKRQMERQFPYY